MSLTDLKIKEATAELTSWLTKPGAEEERFSSIVTGIKEKIDTHTVSKSIFRQLEYLNFWHSNKFVYEALTLQKVDRNELATNGYYTLLVSATLAKKYPNNPPYLLFDRVAYWLCNCLAQQWYKESGELLTLINDGLTNFLKGGLDFKPMAWFIVEVANKGYQIDYDFSKYNYPSSLGVYQKALDNWDTNDLELLDLIVSDLCEFHQQNASYGDGQNIANIQFGENAWFVYTFEILAWLSIRTMIGKPNPENFSHPLMQLALNQLTSNTSGLTDNTIYKEVLAQV